MVEREVNSVDKAGLLGDQYTLTHKLGLERPPKYCNGKRKFNNYVTPPESTCLLHEYKGKSDNPERIRRCYCCGKAGHQVREC